MTFQRSLCAKLQFSVARERGARSERGHTSLHARLFARRCTKQGHLNTAKPGFAQVAGPSGITAGTSSTVRIGARVSSAQMMEPRASTEGAAADVPELVAMGKDDPSWPP
jgi:hypothetical protein